MPKRSQYRGRENFPNRLRNWLRKLPEKDRKRETEIARRNMERIARHIRSVPDYRL